MGSEQRFMAAADFQGEFRVEKRDGKPSLITGYPAKFNKLSQRMWGMRGQILPGAFKRTLAEGADVRGLLNHNPDFVLGRNKAGTMRLSETSVGLRMEIDAPDTQVARDLMTSIDRGDITQGSFRFKTVTDNWHMQDGETIRDLIDVDLMDVSVVTFPAYEDTDIGVRSLSAAAGMDVARFSEIVTRIEHNLPAKSEDRDFLGLLIHRAELLRAKLPEPELRNLESATRRLRLLQATDCLGLDVHPRHVATSQRDEKRDAASGGEKRDAHLTKKVDGEDLSAHDFIIAEKADDTDTWHLPCHFSTEAKTVSHLRDALARFDQVKGISDAEKKKALTKLKHLAKAHGIDVSD